MSFFSRLGLQFHDFAEANHGQKEEIVYGLQQPIAIETSSNSKIVGDSFVQHKHQIPTLITELAISVGHDSPATAIDMLVFGANSFTSEQVVVAKGFFITVHRDNRSILNLYLDRVKEIPLRVAQIFADVPVSFRGDKAKRKVIGNELNLYHGVHTLQPDSDGNYFTEYHFLSKVTF